MTFSVYRFGTYVAATRTSFPWVWACFGRVVSIALEPKLPLPAHRSHGCGRASVGPRSNRVGSRSLLGIRNFSTEEISMEYSFRLKVGLSMAFLAVLFCGTFAAAQGIVTGSISGTVEDPSGAVVSGAKVSARHLATNREYTTETTAS